MTVDYFESHLCEVVEEVFYKVYETEPGDSVESAYIKYAVVFTFLAPYYFHTSRADTHSTFFYFFFCFIDVPITHKYLSVSFSVLNFSMIASISFLTRKGSSL